MATPATAIATPTEISATTAKPAVKKVAAPAKAAAPKATATKTAAKPAAKPAPKAPAKPAARAPKAPVAAKVEKTKKVKLVRDSLSIPKDEFEVIAVLKARAAKLGHAAKKTEVIRAGIKAVAALSDQALLKALQAVPSIKTGRPAKSKGK